MWSSTECPEHLSISATDCYKMCSMKWTQEFKVYPGLWYGERRGQQKEMSGEILRGAGENLSGKTVKATPGLELALGLGRSWHTELWGPAVPQCFRKHLLYVPHGTMWTRRDPRLPASRDRGQDGSRASLLLISDLLPAMPHFLKSPPL